MTGVKAGTAKITAKVKSKGKSYSLSCTVTVTTEKTVTTAKQLRAALKNKKLTKLTFKTGGKKTYTIPKGTHSKLALVIDTPNADVVNYGVFKSITIKAIKADTFTERAANNKIKVTADSARLIIDDQAQADQITVAKKDAKVTIVVQGEVGEVAVTKPANVVIVGSTTTNVPVTIADAAKDSEITANVPIDLTTGVDIRLNLEEGAAGSKITATKDGIDLVDNITNGTGSVIEVTTPNGTELVETGRDEEEDPETPEEPETPSAPATPSSPTTPSSPSGPSNTTQQQTQQESFRAAHQIDSDGTLTIPSTVTSIPAGTYKGNTSLKKIVIEDGVKNLAIGEWAFYDCKNLTSITLPSGVISIGKYAFKDCTGLTGVTIPSSVTQMGDSAFSGCTGLSRVTINSTVVGAWAFGNCTTLSSVTLNDVTTIGHDAFYGCTLLTSVTIPATVKSIGSYAFYGCTGLSSVTIENTAGNVTVNEKAFEITPTYKEGGE